MPVFIRLVEERRRDKEDHNVFADASHSYFFDPVEFKKLPGSPFAYWLNQNVISIYENGETLGCVFAIKEGLGTRNDEKFLRAHWEVSKRNIDRTYWVPTDKAGTNRKWYGGHIWVLDWRDDGYEIKNLRNVDGSLKSRPQNTQWFFHKAVSWGKVGTGSRSFRYRPDYFAFNDAAPSLFGEPIGPVLAFLNSTVASSLMRIQGGTINVTTSVVGNLPFVKLTQEVSVSTVRDLLALAKEDWDAIETSIDFYRSPLLRDYNTEHAKNEIDDLIYNIYRPTAARFSRQLQTACSEYMGWCSTKLKDSVLMETKNNEFFVDLFNLRNEVETIVSFSDITLLEDIIDRDALRFDEIVFNKQEIMKQFVSYGVGCIFGRYSLDKEGLILANAGDNLDAYIAQIPEPTLRPDKSGILPITNDNDFADDLPSQWRVFLRAAFGDEYYEGNLRFLEEGLGKRLRPYFLKGFYDDHVKRYKKRPIYWLITSPKGTLQALIYLHRYNRDTVNRFLNDYLRPYQQKLKAKRVSAEYILTGGRSSQSEKTKAQKRLDEIRKALEELSTWERDVVRPLAEKRIELDLDDGVKVNYGKLGAILAKVKGLNA